MALLWMDGFDHYGEKAKMLDGVYAEVGANASLSASDGTITSRTGTHHFRFNNNSAASLRRALGSNYRVTGFGGGLYMVSLPATSTELVLCEFRDADNNIQYCVSLDTTGAIRLGQTIGGTQDFVGTSPAFVTGAWQHFEIRLDCDASAGAVEVRVNGVTVANVTGINTRPFTSASGGVGRVAQVMTRFAYNFPNYPFALDDIFAWADTGATGDMNNDFIGDRSVITLYPNADTSVADFDVQQHITVPTIANDGTKSEAASGGITLVTPSSPEIGDIWIAVIHSTDQVAHTLTDWTEIVQGNGGGTTSRLSVWYFRYAGTVPNMVVGHTAGDSIIAGVLTVKGCVTSGSPVDVFSAIGAGTDTSIEHTTVTPSQTGDVLLVINGSGVSQNRTALGGGYAVAFQNIFAGNIYHTTLGTDGSIALFYDLDVPASATGTVTVTQAGAGAWASTLIALKRAAVNSTYGYEAINDTTADDDTSYLEGVAPVGSPSQEFSEFGLENMPSNIGAITAVQTYTRMKKSSVGDCNVQVSLKSGGQVSSGADRAITEAYTYWMDVSQLDPATGAPWTKAALDAALLRISRTI